MQDYHMGFARGWVGPKGRHLAFSNSPPPGPLFYRLVFVGSHLPSSSAREEQSGLTMKRLSNFMQSSDSKAPSGGVKGPRYSKRAIADLWHGKWRRVQHANVESLSNMLEDLYWKSVSRELINVIRTLSVWLQHGDEIRAILNSHSGNPDFGRLRKFVEQVTTPGRQYRSAHSKSNYH